MWRRFLPRGGESTLGTRGFSEAEFVLAGMVSETFSSGTPFPPDDGNNHR